MNREIAARILRLGKPNAGGWVRANCPFCEGRTGKADRHRSFGVSVHGRYHCFRCGIGGQTDATTETPLDEQELKQRGAISAPEGFCRLVDEPAAAALAFAPARSFVRARQVAASVVRDAQIGACISGPARGRVVVPVLAPDQRTWLWWVARAWIRKSARPYLYPSGGREGLIYNYAALLVETDAPVIVVEGVFDTFPFWPDAVALLGDYGREQVYTLAAARRPLAVVLDGDAWEKGWVLSELLRIEGARAGFVKLPPRMDPDDVPDLVREEAPRCVVG